MMISGNINNSDTKFKDLELIKYFDEGDNWKTGLRIIESMMTEHEKKHPDTFGAEAFFIECGFLTEKMLDDFPVIAKAFFENTSYSLFDSIHFTDTSFSASNPYSASTKKILSKILCYAKNGDIYSIKLLIYLYQIYHKKEYRMLKRFDKLNAVEIVDISTSNNTNISVSANISRVLTICKIMGKKVDDNCAILYAMINNEYKYAKGAVEKSKYYNYEKKDYENAIDEISEMINCGSYEKLNIINEYSIFTRMALQYFGYRNDYVEKINTNIGTYTSELAISKMFLDKIDSERSYTFEQLQHFASYFHIISTLCYASNDAERYLDLILGYEDEYCLKEAFNNSPLFEADHISADVNNDELEKISTMKQDKPINNSEKVLISEIKELRMRLHEKEHSLQNMTNLFLESKNRLKSVESYVEKYNQLLNEVVALREYVYNESIAYSEPLEIDIVEDMKRELNKKRVLIIGGPDNWINKLKKDFSNWSFVNYKSSTSISDSILDNMDYIFFYTGFLKHKVYYRFINLLRNRKLDFGYINSTNIELTIVNVYEEIYRKKGDKSKA